MRRGTGGIAGDDYTRGVSDASRRARTTSARGVTPVRPSLLSATAVKNAVVVGAGPCGLLASLELVQNGASVTLVEQRNGYTRPIHWNVRADLLHRIAETCPGALQRVLERLGAIESAESIDATTTTLPPEKLEALRKDKPQRRVTIGPSGLVLQQKGVAAPPADAQRARFGGRTMLKSASVGQILTVDLENILFGELERIAAQPKGDRPSVTILRNHRLELVDSADKKGFKACTAYEVTERTEPGGKAVFAATGKRIRLGTPDLIVSCDGANSQMRTMAGIARTHVSAPTRFIAASIASAAISAEAPHGGLARRRYAEVTNPEDGKVHGLRQVVLGITTAPQSWVLVEVPPWVDLTTKEATADFFYAHAAPVVGRSEAELRKLPVTWGPNPFGIQQYISATAVHGENVIFAGDAVGSAHFLTSGGVMVATVPHIFALEKLLANLADGVPRKIALDRYDRWALAGTKEWLRLGFGEFGRRGAQTETFESAMAAALERLRHARGSA